MITFFNWLKDQTYRNDKIGKLARDIADNTSLPVKKTKTSILAHSISIQADVRVFHTAWKEYKYFKKCLFTPTSKKS